MVRWSVIDESIENMSVVWWLAVDDRWSVGW